jgi:hypothetical protein
MTFIKAHLNMLGSMFVLKIDIMDQDTCIFSSSTEYNSSMSQGALAAWKALGTTAGRYRVPNIFLTGTAKAFPRELGLSDQRDERLFAAIRFTSKGAHDLETIGVWAKKDAPPEDGWHFWIERMDNMLAEFDSYIWPKDPGQPASQPAG